MPLTIAHEECGPRAVLTVTGDLDLATADELASVGLALVEAGAPAVIVDAQALTFCDSSGLSALVRIANRLGERDGQLAIVGPTPIVRRVLDLSGLADTLVIASSMPAAITALNSAPRRLMPDPIREDDRDAPRAG